MAKMDDLELKAILAAEKSTAMGDDLGGGGSDLTQQRAESMDFYQGDMDKYMPTVEGRSKSISTDVSDTIDGMMPDLMDIFMGSDEVVRFNAVGEEDEEAALQETDFVNHAFFVDNPGFTTLHSFIKDALIQKNGIVKFWWEEGDEQQRETYTDLTEDAFALLVDEDRVELIEHTERPGADEDGQPTTLHDAVVVMKTPFGKPAIMAVPPEEFLIARDARDIRTSRYCAHVTKKTRSELIDEGFDRELVEGLPTGTQVLGEEEDARGTVEDNDSALTEGADSNKAMQKIEITEHYIRLDWDGDGIAELRKVTTAGAGNEILDNDAYDNMPFAGITPILMSHRFWGRALADLVKEIMKINTALTRSMLDNIYYMNSQRMEVPESHCGDNTIDDVLTNRPGSPIRTKTPGGLNVIPVNSIVQHILPVIEHFNVARETRTGVSRFNAGPSADSLNPFNSTLGGANIVVSAGQKRIRLIARTFAETGIKDMFLGLHELILKHGKEARQVKLRNKWVTVDPRNWKTRKDMKVMVGLGTGTKDQIDQQLTRILGFQVQAIQMQGSAEGPLVTINEVHNTLKKITENAGFRDTEPFFKEPQEGEQPQRQERPDPKMAEVQGKLQLEAAKLQGQQQIEQAKLASDQQQNVASLEAKRQATEVDARVKMFEAQLEASTDLRIAGMKADLEAQVAEMRADLETAIAVRKQNVDADAKIRAGGKIG